MVEVHTLWRKTFSTVSTWFRFQLVNETPSFPITMLHRLTVITFLSHVPVQGFEPRQTDSESVVLPLDETGMYVDNQGIEPCSSACKAVVLPISLIARAQSRSRTYIARRRVFYRHREIRFLLCVSGTGIEPVTGNL